MANSNASETAQDLSELQQDLAKRKAWFLECQLRRFTLETFRGIRIDAEWRDPLVDLISEDMISAGFVSGQIGIVNLNLGKVYLDSQQPVWTKEEGDQREKFAEETIGKIGDWLDHKKPKRLIEKLESLRMLFEESYFSSVIDISPDLNRFGRKDTKFDELTHAIARTAICEEKPWLIPELFTSPNLDGIPAQNWLENLEQFISNYEKELLDIVGSNPLMQVVTAENINEYKDEMKSLIELSLNKNPADSVKVEFSRLEKDKYVYDIKMRTTGFALDSVSKYPHSTGLPYWAKSKDLKDIYLSNQNADMGLCIVMRALYLYGNLPASLGSDDKLRWRKRSSPAEKLKEMLDRRAGEDLIKKDEQLQARFNIARSKLNALVELQVEFPRSGSLCFSPLYGEVLKQVITQFKFWLDEPFRAYDNHGQTDDKEDNPKGVNKARQDIGAGKVFQEMEYWSENHYIMFASSEYLAGQLWPDTTFQPVRDFLGPGDKTGQLDGKSRRERGKARTLKWLNNKLLFGWTEFNSSGYYREHMWALLNLVDFAMDEEVRKKALVVLDLLVFDLVRFNHKGSMGACGGRSQFKSRNNGWDNGPADPIEMMLGTRGIFEDANGEIGCCFATTTYKVPEVLLEIGKNPPDFSFVDRTRVSITFAEAPKYGIHYSKGSDQRKSLERGFQPKRDKHFKSLATVNDAITKSHFDYKAWEDDTIFWWGMSAFYNTEIVRNSFDCREKFGLRLNDPWKGFVPFMISIILPLINRTGTSILGALIGGLPGAVAGFLIDDILSISDRETSTDELSLFLEGSSRTRANILTYRNKDVMLSSIQNFRVGQLNFQSNVHQATISGDLNVFTTSSFPGFHINDLEALLATTALSAPFGFFWTAAVGTVGVILNELLIKGENPLGDNVDGPGYWTGYWSLPMVLQHENAAIVAYDFHWLQKRLTNHASHAWFPKKGFDSVEERRTSAYDDENFFLFDITDIGPKGFWLFGKKVHKQDPLDPAADEEAYVGVFSNQRPKWLNKDSDFYEDHLKAKSVDNPKSDFFADKDWSVGGKNIWILQVGNKKDYFSFENFKDRVSKAKIELDDVGTLECTYHIPRSDGSSQALSLEYQGACKLDGNAFETDLYPRFENPFIRGGFVEWGQREYVIEYRDKTLVHDFSNLDIADRSEDGLIEPDQLNTIKGLVIYLTTGDENMDTFSVAQATVMVGCETLAVDEIIAAGEVEKNTAHDAEWIFFDRPGVLMPDMTIEIKHPATSDGDDDPEWKMSFTLKALLGDRSLHDCSVSFSSYYFEDERRSTGRIPFAVQLSKWRPWQEVDELFGKFDFWQMVENPRWANQYHDVLDVLAVDSQKRLWHRRLGPCAANNTEWSRVGKGTGPLVNNAAAVWALSSRPGLLSVFVNSNGEIFHCTDTAPANAEWSKLIVQTVPTFLGIPIPNAAPVPIPVSSETRLVVKESFPLGALDLFLCAADDNFYMQSSWLPGDSNSWSKIITNSVFEPSGMFAVARNFLFAVDDKHHLWAGEINGVSAAMSPDWKQITDNLTTVNNVLVAQQGSIFQLLINVNQGEIRVCGFQDLNSTIAWQRLGAADKFLAKVNSRVAWTSSAEDRLDLFTVDTAGKVYTIAWTGGGGWQSSWTLVNAKSQSFVAAEPTQLFALSRVRNLIEVFTSSSDKKLWKTWWS